MNAEGKVFEHDFYLDDEAVQSAYESVCMASYEEGQPLKVLSEGHLELDFNLIRTVNGEMVYIHANCYVV